MSSYLYLDQERPEPMRLELLQQILAPRMPTVREVELTLRKVLWGKPSEEIAEKVGTLYGNAFRANEREGVRRLR